MKRLHRKSRGQSLILVTFAVLTLIAFIGLGIDLGLSYLARVRTQRAVDAASLAAASELPLEGIAHVRALEYLAENGYDCDLTLSVSNTATCSSADVRVEVDGNHLSGPDAETADYILTVDTIAYRGVPSAPNSANRIRVSVTEMVDLYFMRFFGFDRVPVAAEAVAENISELDVALVFDKSGSMEYDTLCYGCWTPDRRNPYPEGARWPLPWNGPAGGPPAHCSGDDEPLEYGDEQYIIIEAEDYSRLSNLYTRDATQIGQTYWVIGRNNRHGSEPPDYLRDGNGPDALGRDRIGAYLAYHPARDAASGDGTGVICRWSDLNNDNPRYNYPADRMCSRNSWVMAQGGPFPAPRADYVFTVPSDETWYFWLRGQGGGSQEGTVEGQHIFWGLSGGMAGDYRLIGRSAGYPTGGYYNGAQEGAWGWERLGCNYGDNQPCGQILNEGTTYTLHLWAGTPGFDVDRIIITTDPSEPSGASVDKQNRILFNEHPDAFDNNRTDAACSPCDARYGGYPGGPGGNEPPNCTSHPQPYRYLDDLYDDEQPIRDSVEAAKTFIRKLNPDYDQIGVVAYSSLATISSKLECVRRLGRDACDMEELEDTAIQVLDETHAGGGTNIAHGVKLGIDVLSTQETYYYRTDRMEQQYGRPSAARIMIVMTDGQANQALLLDDACDDEDYWTKNDGPVAFRSAKDCTVYYALQARNEGIIIYSITLGSSADIELMEYIAELTGGIHRHAPTADQLGPIFDEIYERIFLRIVK